MPTQGAILNALLVASTAAGLHELNRRDGVLARLFWAHRRRRLLPINLEEWFEHELARLDAPYQLVGLRASGRSEWPVLFRRPQQIAIDTRITARDVLGWLDPNVVPERLDEAWLSAASEIAFACWALGLDRRASARRPRNLAQTYREAGRAAATLRRVLPRIVEYGELSGDARAAGHQALLSTIRAANFAVPSQQQRPRDWRAAAPRLAELFSKMMADRATGWSRKGPAVKFLVRALRRIYPGANITLAAIEQALSRDRKRRRVT